MYFLFDSEVRSFRNSLLFAEIVSPIPDPSFDWWDAQPFARPLPPFVFEFTHNRPPPDAVYNGPDVQLYSAHLVALLVDAGVSCETFPTTILHRKTKALLSDTHVVVHLLEKAVGLDRRTTFVDKPVLSKLRMQEPTLFFRDAEFPYHVLIHEDLKARFDAAGMSGCRYRPVHDPIEGPGHFL
jgi:hypothetical protein